MKIQYFLIVLFSFFNIASATTSSYETQLIKLAKSLKGEPATLAEREALQVAVTQGTADAFLQQKTQEYLADTKFSLKLKQKVDELVRLIPQTQEGAVSNDTPGRTPTGLTAYDNLIRKTIQQNLSWDNLLLGKEYQTYGFGSGLHPEEKFYAMLIPQYQDGGDFSDIFPDITKPPQLLSFQFDKSDTRLAGILTTPRFFDRYVNTALNKNRRRAAAVFRIFLCDTMIPTVPTQDSASEAGDYDTILPGHKNTNEEDIRRSLSGNVHGQQADCMKCHYKLDPLGQTFGFSATTLGIHPSPGALRFVGDDGRKVDISVQGLGELAEQIVKQPEYEKCQVSYFWRWYIGKDVPLPVAREEKLVQIFNQVGRRPKDFIAYLTTLTEFKEKPQVLNEDQLLARRVAKVFKNCNSCHESQGETVWDLTDLPYGNDPLIREKRIQKLKKVLDIDNNGIQATMPPKDSLWKPSQDEFAILKKWMDHGAPDFQGIPQVTSPAPTPASLKGAL